MTPSSARPRQGVNFAAVAVGGAAGALLRYALTSAEPLFAWHTILVNISGSFLLAFLAAGVFPRTTHLPWLRPLIGTGVLGGYTTFSSVMVTMTHLTWWASVLYFAVTALTCLLASAAGYRVGSRWARSAATRSTAPSGPGEEPRESGGRP